MTTVQAVPSGTWVQSHSSKQGPHGGSDRARWQSLARRGNGSGPGVHPGEQQNVASIRAGDEAIQFRIQQAQGLGVGCPAPGVDLVFCNLRYFAIRLCSLLQKCLIQC